MSLLYKLISIACGSPYVGGGIFDVRGGGRPGRGRQSRTLYMSGVSKHFNKWNKPVNLDFRRILYMPDAFAVVFRISLVCVRQRGRRERERGGGPGGDFQGSPDIITC